MADWKDLGPGDLIAEKLVKSGPLAAQMTSIDAAKNAQAIRDTINPAPVPEGLELMRPRSLAKGISGELIGQDPFNPKAKEILPHVAGAVAPLAIPMTRPIMGPLLRTGAAGLAAGGVSKLLGGEFTSPALTGALPQLGGEAVFGATRLARNPAQYRAFAEKQAADITKAIKAKVPAWAEFPEGSEGLNKMLYSQEGMTKLSEMYDQYIQSIKKAAAPRPPKATYIGDQQVPGGKPFKLYNLEEDIPGHPKGSTVAEQSLKPVEITVDLPLEYAAKLGMIRQSGAREMGPLSTLPVNAGELAEAITGKWKKDPGMYRAVVRLLDETGLGDPKIREAYKWSQGISQFIDKTRALKGEQYHPESAMGGLTDLKKVNELRRRGMGEAIDLIRGPGESPVTARNLGPWERRAYGAAAGELGGLMGGHPFAGIPIGAAAGELMIPKTLYSGVPLGPLGKQAYGRGPTAAAEGIRLLMGSSPMESSPTE